MLRLSRGQVLNLLGVALLFGGTVGEKAGRGWLYNADPRFASRAELIWIAVSQIGVGLIGVGFLLDAARAKKPWLSRAVGIVLLVLAAGLLALLPVVRGGG